MSIKQFETKEQLKIKLINRGLTDKNNKIDEALRNLNYFNIINGLETLFLDKGRPKRLRNVDVQDFTEVYEFDKKFKSEILIQLNCIEEKLKSSIAHHFSAKYCATIDKTMEYTNKLNYMNPAENNRNSPNYCRYHNAYPFKEFQNKKIYNEFHDFNLFKNDFLTKLIRNNDHINETFYSCRSYVATSNVAIFKDRNNNRNVNVAVPFWVAIETLSFGNILRLLHYLHDDVMGKILADFDLLLKNRMEFLNMLDVLVCSRNYFAHKPLASRFRTNSNFIIGGSIVQKFQMQCKYSKNGRNFSVINLFDVLKIIHYFGETAPVQKQLKKIVYKNNKRMGHRRAMVVNNEILRRIGCYTLKEFKTIANYTAKDIIF